MYNINMVAASESELKEMWEEFGDSDKKWISDHCGGGIESFDYENVIKSYNNPTNATIFKNCILYVDSGRFGELYEKDEETGKYENAFYR